MEHTGIVRRIDELGRVAIPKEIRRTLRIREGDPLAISVDSKNRIINIKKYHPEKVFDFDDEELKEIILALTTKIGQINEGMFYFKSTGNKDAELECRQSRLVCEGIINKIDEIVGEAD